MSESAPSAARLPPEPWSLEPDRLLGELHSRPGGLSTDEARARRAIHGTNELTEAPVRGPLAILLDQFKSPLIYILLIAGAVTIVVEEYLDAAVIAFVLVLNAVVGFIQEYRAAKSMAALREISRARAGVLRDGHERDLDAAELVPGDIILLETGDRVPADGRLLRLAALEVDESLLTGESVVVAKGAAVLPPATLAADRLNSIYLGTIVTRGRGRAVVTAIGNATELGRVAVQVGGIEEPKTPLQRRMSGFARIIGAAIMVACGMGMVIGLAQGMPFEEVLLVMVALAVSAIPEGLPIVLTVVLAISVRRMAKRNALIRHLPAVETLGSCTVIGSDKTGTLTQNRMTVAEIRAGGRRYDVTGGGYNAEGRISHAGAGLADVERDGPLHLALLVGGLCNDATLRAGETEYEVHGDPTEIALLVAAAKGGLLKDELEDRYVRIAEIPFESEARFAATFHRDVTGERGRFVAVKGAPERVLEMCRWDLDGQPVDAADVLVQAEVMAAGGLRVLAFGYRQLSAESGDLPDLAAHLDDLRFVGLQGMIDPPREEAIDAIRGCQQAGIRVLMITGDHATTALAIAQQLGIAGPADRVVTGAELEHLDDDSMLQIVPQWSVYARVSPEHKLRIVTALKELGQIVAVTGDGINDAPALKAADIGAAMGRSGTDVAREAADMVITDDNFASIFAAVKEGRVAFDNVRKTTFFLISTGAAEVVAVLASLLFVLPLPFLPAQLLWLNVVTNGVEDVALAFEPGEEDVLRRKPRPVGEGVISRLLWERTVLTGLVMAAGTLMLFVSELNGHGNLARAQTVALTTMVLFQVFHVGNSRSEHRSAFAKSPFSNPFLFVGTLAALLLHIAALYLPFTQFVLRVEPLDLETWLRMIVVAASIIVVIEAHKFVRGPGGLLDRLRAPRSSGSAANSR